jgi:hypothetical protein
MSAVTKAPWLHITSQFHEHGEAYLTGTTEGLEALRDAIDAALKTGDATAEVYATDGEGYGIIVRRSNTVAGLGEPIYFETLARDAYHTEIRLHEHIVRDRRRKRTQSKEQPA